MTIGIGNEWAAGDPQEIHDEPQTTTWYRFYAGDIEPFQVFRETEKMLVYLNRWGEQRRENKTRFHFRNKRDAIQFALDRADKDIVSYERLINAAKERQRKYKQMMLELE